MITLEMNKKSLLTIGERDVAVISAVVRSRRQFNSDSWVHECRSDCSGVSATLKAAAPPFGPGSVCRSNFIARFPGLSDYLSKHGPENRNAWALSLLPQCATRYLCVRLTIHSVVSYINRHHYLKKIDTVIS